MTLFLKKIIEHWIFIRFRWFICQNLLILMNFKKKKKRKLNKKHFWPENSQKTLNLRFRQFLPPLSIIFLHFLVLQVLDFDFTNIWVPTFWKSDKNFSFYDFLLFLFLRFSSSVNVYNLFFFHKKIAKIKNHKNSLWPTFINRFG